MTAGNAGGSPDRSAADGEGFAIDSGKVRAWKRYPTYKDSGVEWLGEVPTGWELARLKYAVRMITQRTIDQNSSSNYIGLENIESWTGRLIAGDALDPEGQSGSFESGDVLFGKLRPYLAKVHKATVDGMCSTEILVLRPKLVNQDYLFYYLLNSEFIKTVNSSTYGTKMPRANWDFIGNLLIPNISLHDQSAIAAFLDRETARIDALIGKKRRFIELLEEKRQAIISHAVTKGLDPGVAMKDSGVEWIGEVPAHWDVINLKQSWDVIDCKHRTAEYVDDGIPIVSTTEVKPGRLSLGNTRLTTESEYLDLIQGRCPKKGDIVLSRNASLGSAAYVDTDQKFCMGQDVCLVKSKDCSQLYLMYQINSPIVQNQIESTMIGATIRRINVNQIKNLLVVKPPRVEQELIGQFLDFETAKIDTVTNTINQQIERLQEYRTALISAAVTGKIDVRDEEAA